MPTLDQKLERLPQSQAAALGREPFVVKVRHLADPNRKWPAFNLCKTLQR
jgi:hypothetical protein